MRGKFVTIEGGEGVGKTTNIAFIERWFEEQGIDYIVTREPGGTPYAERIRELLLEHREERLDPMAELLMIFAARAQHLARVIRPALDAGRWVLCDRFTDATYAYQGGGRELGLEAVATLENLVQGELRPDLTLILDIDPHLGMERVNDRGEPDRFESEEQRFFQRVRQTYLELAGRDPVRYALVDASRPLEQVQLSIGACLEAHLATEPGDGR